MTSPRETLSEELNQRRQDLVLKWTAVARQLGMSPQHLLRIRNGDVPMTSDVAVAIDKFLGRERGYTWNLVGETNKAPATTEVEPDELTDEQILGMTHREIAAHILKLPEDAGRALLYRVAGLWQKEERTVAPKQ